MNNLGFDHHAELFLARAHAAELRDAWRSANGPSLGRGDEPEEPCSERQDHTLALVVARLITGLSRERRVAAAEPCSEGRMTA
jgi:hypothetical protein